MAIIHEVIEHKWYDQDFVDKWTYGFDELAERVKDWTPERAAEDVYKRQCRHRA